MKVGVIGSGEVGRRLASGFATLGHEVVIGTRHPEGPELLDWKVHAGPQAHVGSFADAARQGDVVVLATLGAGAGEAIQLAGPDHFAGKVVIDVTNPLVFHENGPPTLFVGTTDSLGEQVQRWLPQARVVKAFNTVGNANFVRPKFPGGEPDMVIAGNDPAAKAKVTEILHEFGWASVVDLGGLDGARWMEAFSVLWVRSALALGTWDLALHLLRK